MYMTPTNNRNASQSIVRTSNSSSQHPQIFQQQHSTQQQHSVIRQPSSQVTNLFGPVRSSPTRCDQHSTSPYDIHSPRTNRRHETSVMDVASKPVSLEAV
ncbi:unnamed protein product, partial [Rotaria magnacalcarata]